MTHPGGPKLVQVDPETRQRVAALVEQHGVAEAVRRTGLGRLAVLGIMGRGSTTAANAALLARGFGVGPANGNALPPVMAGAAAALRGGSRF